MIDRRMGGRLNYLKLIIFLWVWIGLRGQAWAYLDMNTGSYAIQLLISAILSGLFFFKRPVLRLKRYVERIFGRKESKPKS